MKDVYISTGGFKNLTGYQSALMLIDHGFDAIELSGGNYSPNVSIELKKLNELASIQLHNYFPPPKVPFVLNLASDNISIKDKSINIVKNGIDLASKLQRKYYSFHAGFRLDPLVSELGKKLRYSKLIDKKTALKYFIESLEEISTYSLSKNVSLMIENNVCNSNAIKNFSCSPYLLDSPSSIIDFFKVEVSRNFGLLLDVAHLKVSAKSLNFDLISAIKNINPFVHGYHLSDNDGLNDTNERFNNRAWYWDLISKDVDYYTVEVYSNRLDLLSDQVKLARDIING